LKDVYLVMRFAHPLVFSGEKGSKKSFSSFWVVEECSPGGTTVSGQRNHLNLRRPESVAVEGQRMDLTPAHRPSCLVVETKIPEGRHYTLYQYYSVLALTVFDWMLTKHQHDK